MRDLAIILSALADPTRLEMLALLLRNEELCVCDFVGTLGISQSKASRHLRYMWNAGLLDDRRAGLWVYYRIAVDCDPERAGLIEAIRKVFDARDMGELDAKHAQWLKRKATTLACGSSVGKLSQVQKPRRMRAAEARR